MSTVSKISTKETSPKVRTERALKPFGHGMEEFFDTMFGHFPTRWTDVLRDPFRADLPSMREFAAMRDGGFPAIDMIDREKDLLVRCELPGVRKKDLEISIAGDRLVIEGKREYKTEDKDETYFRSELGYGTVSRTLRLPVPVDEKNVKAELIDGMLEITLPKTEVRKRHVVKVA